MPRPSWDDEDKNMHPTCESASDDLTGPEVAFLARIKNKDRLSIGEQDRLRDIWFKIAPESDR